MYEEAPDTSSTYTCSSLLTSPDPDEYVDHNMWNPLLVLLCHVQIAVIMEMLYDEETTGKGCAFLPLCT